MMFRSRGQPSKIQTALPPLDFSEIYRLRWLEKSSNTIFRAEDLAPSLVLQLRRKDIDTEDTSTSMLLRLLSAGSKQTAQNLGPEGRRARGHKAAKTLGAKGCSARSRKSAKTLGADGLRARGLKAAETQKKNESSETKAARAARAEERPKKRAAYAKRRMNKRKEARANGPQLSKAEKADVKAEKKQRTRAIRTAGVQRTDLQVQDGNALKAQGSGSGEFAGMAQCSKCMTREAETRRWSSARVAAANKTAKGCSRNFEASLRCARSRTKRLPRVPLAPEQYKDAEDLAECLVPCTGITGDLHRAGSLANILSTWLGDMTREMYPGLTTSNPMRIIGPVSNFGCTGKFQRNVGLTSLTLQVAPQLFKGWPSALPSFGDNSRKVIEQALMFEEILWLLLHVHKGGLEVREGKADLLGKPSAKFIGALKSIHSKDKDGTKTALRLPESWQYDAEQLLDVLIPKVNGRAPATRCQQCRSLLYRELLALVRTRYPSLDSRSGKLLGPVSGSQAPVP